MAAMIANALLRDFLTLPHALLTRVVAGLTARAKSTVNLGDKRLGFRTGCPGFRLHQGFDGPPHLQRRLVCRAVTRASCPASAGPWVNRISFAAISRTPSTQRILESYRLAIGVAARPSVISISVPHGSVT